MTAEVAITFPVVVLALAVVLLAGSVAQAGVSCADAARSAGRVLARGDTIAAAAAAAREVAGRPVTVQVARAGAARSSSASSVDPGQADGLVVVTATVQAGPALVPSWGDPAAWRLPVTCRARAWHEPTA